MYTGSGGGGVIISSNFINIIPNHSLSRCDVGGDSVTGSVFTLSIGRQC